MASDSGSDSEQDLLLEHGIRRGLTELNNNGITEQASEKKNDLELNQNYTYEEDEEDNEEFSDTEAEIIEDVEEEEEEEEPLSDEEDTEKVIDEKFMTERQQLASKFEKTLENLYQKYSEPWALDTDEVNLLTGEILVDKGHLRSLREAEDRIVWRPHAGSRGRPRIIRKICDVWAGELPKSHLPCRMRVKKPSLCTSKVELDNITRLCRFANCSVEFDGSIKCKPRKTKLPEHLSKASVKQKIQRICNLYENEQKNSKSS